MEPSSSILNNKKLQAWLMLALLVAMVVVGLLFPASWRLEMWLVLLVLILGFTVLAGYIITERIWGVLIDARNRFSLSRLQILGWTVLVLSGYLAAATFNLRAGLEDPLAIAIPEQLWILMGISTTSFIGSPLLLSVKATRNADRGQFKRTLELLPNEAVEHTANCETLDDETRPVGMVLENNTPKAAAWTDLFQGEETGNGAHLDLARVQMFFFTLILLIVYAVSLGQSFMEGEGTITAFPIVHDSMIVLLGISHTGYLGGKMLPHSKEESPAAGGRNTRRPVEEDQ